MEHQFELVLLLLAIAAGITAVAKKLNAPYPIALVIVGAILGLVHIPGLEELKHFIVEDEIFTFVIVSIFLPTLLGEATLKLPFSHLKENKTPILAMALFGTLVTYTVIGFLAVYLLDLPLEVAFVFAALMAATDPVSVLSIFKSMGVNHRLSTIIEGESLINDGVAYVLFKISLTTFIFAGFTEFGEGLWEFFKGSFGGLAIGLLLAYLFSKILRHFDDYPLEIVFSMLLFYGAFFIAEIFHFSGVISVVAAGLVFGNYGAKIGMSPTTKLNIKTFWDVLALIANSFVFLMVGLEIANIDLSGKWMMILLAILIVLVGRSIAIYGSLAFNRHIPMAWKHVFNWGGLKGSLSIALALSLDADFPGREDILVLTFGVVLFSLVIQGLTIKPLVNFLGVTKTMESSLAYERTLSEIHQATAGRNAIEEMKSEATISPVIYTKLDNEYQGKLDALHKKLEHLYKEFPKLQEDQMTSARKKSLYAEYEAVEELAKQHLISGEIAEEEYKKIIDLLEKEEDTDSH
ncbi:Na+/H+ antiporter [Chengkuizengella axinellae]|uniref:Na+/H+ antiporter n=1 Tax=Chengkuizengella axinellae TaxID=3064388 RepID=A0ABT9IVF1_9BACL|nr:Na+/H+ antiporter [Chengkuizengella sp. 2205SS18-9]MDP5272775.1 Na+/H+ antiporter [Chengkuizengella sp. 2205SS18-9]